MFWPKVLRQLHLPLVVAVVAAVPINLSAQQTAFIPYAQIVELASPTGITTDEGIVFMGAGAAKGLRLTLRTWGLGGQLRMRLENTSDDSLRVNWNQSSLEIQTTGKSIRLRTQFGEESIKNGTGYYAEMEEGWRIERPEDRLPNLFRQSTDAESTIGKGKSVLADGWVLMPFGKIKSLVPADRIESMRITDPNALAQGVVKWNYYNEANSPLKLTFTLLVNGEALTGQVFAARTAELERRFVEPTRGYWTVDTAPTYQYSYRKSYGFYVHYQVAK
jgi:hypothetical protein